MPAKVVAELRIFGRGARSDHARDVIAHVRGAGFAVREIGAGGVWTAGPGGARKYAALPPA